MTTDINPSRMGYYLEADARRQAQAFVLDPAVIPVILDKVLDELDEAKERIARAEWQGTITGLSEALDLVQRHFDMAHQKILQRMVAESRREPVDRDPIS